MNAVDLILGIPAAVALGATIALVVKAMRVGQRYGWSVDTPLDERVFRAAIRRRRKA